MTSVDKSEDISPERECRQMCSSNTQVAACEQWCMDKGMGKCMVHLSQMYDMTDPKGAYFNTDTSGSKFCKTLESLSEQFQEEDWTTISRCSKSLTHVLMLGEKLDMSTPEARQHFFRDFCHVSVMQ